jgi:hypothetical protein
MTEFGAIPKIENNSKFDTTDYNSTVKKEKGLASQQMKERNAWSRDIKFCPFGNEWAVCTSEGVAVYSRKNYVTFDPIDLDTELTPESAIQAIKDAAKGMDSNWLLPLVMCLHLNEFNLIQLACESIPKNDIEMVINNLPVVYIHPLLSAICQLLSDKNAEAEKSSTVQNTRHLEHHMALLLRLLKTYWASLNNKSSLNVSKKMASISALLRSTRQNLVRTREDLKMLLVIKVARILS